MQADTHIPITAGSTALTPQKALRLAWTIWIVLLLLPYVAMPIALRANLRADAGSYNPEAADAWFVAIMLYMVIALPAAFFWRSHLFKAYWRGDTVSPRAYFWGMVSLWAALTIGGLTALVVCIATVTFAPNVIPAALALFVYVILWPDGSAMTRPVGGSDDPETYREPR